MDFKNFIEFNVIGAATRPKQTADLWKQENPGQNYINNSLIRKITQMVVSPRLYGACQAAALTGKSKIVTIHNQPIDGGLVHGMPSILKKNPVDRAFVVVQTIHGFNCMFEVEHGIGQLHAVFPPLVYDPTNEAALASIIIHESQHAQDWMMDKLQGYSSETIPMDEYLESPGEVRAFRRQFFALIDILESEYHMPWGIITAAILEITEKHSAYAVEVVKEFMRLVETDRPALETMTMTVPAAHGTKEQVISQLAQLFIQNTEKHKAGPFLEKLRK